MLNNDQPFRRRRYIKLTKGDIYLVAAILIIAVAGFAVFKLVNGGQGHKEAVIIQDGKVIRRMDLDFVKRPEEIKIDGDYTNIISVEQGRIRFTDADCPNRDCVKTGWISEKGTTAVCLPNRVIIKIEGVNEDIDGGTY